MSQNLDYLKCVKADFVTPPIGSLINSQTLSNYGGNSSAASLKVTFAKNAAKSSLVGTVALAAINTGTADDLDSTITLSIDSTTVNTWQIHFSQRSYRVNFNFALTSMYNTLPIGNHTLTLSATSNCAVFDIRVQLNEFQA